MLSSTVTTVLRLVGWKYIPDLASRKTLQYIHLFFSSRGWSVPKAGTPQWQKHYRYTFATVILGFLTYNLIEASRSAPPSLYNILGVSSNAEEGDLKQAFRAFAKKNHPDHVGSQGEDAFIAVRDAFEALKNPTTRFAYNRFGTGALNWSDCKTAREFLKKGMMHAAGFHVVTGLILLTMSATMGPSPVGFWRYILYAALFASEFSLLVGHQTPMIINFLLPNKVPFQHIAFLHQLFIFLSVALTRVIPVLFAQNNIRQDDPRTYKPLIDRLNNASMILDHETMRILNMEVQAAHGTESKANFADLKPSISSKEVAEALTKEMAEMMVEDRLRREGPIRPLWDEAVEERRREMLAERLEAVKQEDTMFKDGSSIPKGYSEDRSEIANEHIGETVKNDFPSESPRSSSPSIWESDVISHPPSHEDSVDFPNISSGS